VTSVVGAIRSDRKRWVDFMMKFELGMEAPDPRRARNSALTIALSYVAGVWCLWLTTSSCNRFVWRCWVP
jgi:VIT family protein